MILPFSTKWPKSMGELGGSSTNFVEKIWNSFEGIVHDGDYVEFFEMGLIHEGYDYSFEPFFTPKLHTIRHDSKNRWKPGNNIHFYINNRTKDAFQFAPVVECVSVQKIEIDWDAKLDLSGVEVSIYIDGECKARLEPKDGVFIGFGEEIKFASELAKNDGFNCIEDFFAWFSEDFTGKIIHWTDLKY